MLLSDLGAWIDYLRHVPLSLEILVSDNAITGETPAVKAHIDSSYANMADIQLRRARMADASQIQAIFSYYVFNSIATYRYETPTDRIL
jgi:hypothetical protein